MICSISGPCSPSAKARTSAAAQEARVGIFIFAAPLANTLERAVRTQLGGSPSDPSDCRFCPARVIDYAVSMAPERTRDKHPVQEAPGANGLDFRDFLMRACHDLRTPLRSIRTNAELLLTVPQKRQGPDFEQILGFIAEGARKSDSVVDGLSNYSLAL